MAMRVLSWSCEMEAGRMCETDTPAKTSKLKFGRAV